MMNMIPSYYDEHNKIWSGAKDEPYHHDDCSIGRVIFNTMKNYPRNVIQIFDKDGVTMTNGDAITAAIRIAQHFKNMRLCHNDIIGIIARNSTFVLPVAVACLLNCTPFHAINPALDEPTLTHVFGITKPKVIFCDGQDYDKMLLVTKKFKPQIYTITDHIDGVPKVQDLLAHTKTEHFYKPEKLVQSGDQTMAILCSSGTTGMPKGVCISNHKLLSSTGLVFLNCEDVIFCSSGLDWISGVISMILCCTKSCTRVISDKLFSPDEFVRLVKEYKITYALLPPRYINSLIKCPTATPESLASLRLITSSGGAVTISSFQALQRLAQNALINFLYAMTEVGGIAANFGLEKAASCGKIMPGFKVCIVDDDRKNLGPNEVGEIYVQQTKGWNGYYDNPKETQSALDPQGWYHTGDLGYFDEEHFLYVVDRKKEILKYQGIQYWPTEIEKCILELPDVMDACVIGVYDESYGDLAGALIVKVEGSSLSAENIKTHVQKELVVPHKQLNGGILFVEKLPQNQNAKTLRKEAKALFIAAKSSAYH